MAKNTKLSQRGIGDLQRSAERYETYNDGFILPDTLLVVRLDAHRYGDWSSCSDEYPCGKNLTKAFLLTARALMTSSFRALLAYAHGDEISLLLDPSENINPLRRSKIISAFSSAAAIHFMQNSGHAATFDAKLSELSSIDRVAEYLFWQRRYCFRNATTIALRRALLDSGLTKEESESRIHGATEEQRVAQLQGLGITLASIPKTTLRGSLLFWSTVQQDNREHYKIQINPHLPDSDDEFEALIYGHLRKDLNLTHPAVSTPKERPSPVVAKNPPQEKPKTVPQQPRSFQPKRTKKAQVSVFKV